MIILDTCILRGLSLEDSSADFLRTLRAVGERLGIPWMVAEELAAQHAVKYQEKHVAASEALASVDHLTPWKLNAQLEDCDLDRIRRHWRSAYGQLAETLPTSEKVMREALFREANVLPPCKAQKQGKTGSRDAAIWLSAIEYGRKHVDETVYFVSDNTKDFTDGGTYSAPMDRDVADLGDRFVHLTKLDEVVERFTEQVETDHRLVREALELMVANGVIGNEAMAMVRAARYGVDVTVHVGELEYDLADYRTNAILASHVTCESVSNVATYRIGPHEWCTATVEWHIGGLAYLEDASLAAGAGFSWTTAVLFTPSSKNPRLTILRHSAPRPLTAEQFDKMGPAVNRPMISLGDGGADATELEMFLKWMSMNSHHTEPRRGIPRKYEGALMRKIRADRETEIEEMLRQLVEARDAGHGVPRRRRADGES
ncbi:PIN domain-containing protein [Streptomyces mirabilis]|uniref:PIN domain-containing protein n=1 Tax=Streptomyces mirabilis TaxID=68239 RepID=UPI0033D2FDD3